MVFFGLNISESLVTRGSGTSTTEVWTSKRPAEAVVGASPRVIALKIVVFPDWGNPMIPSFIFSFLSHTPALAGGTCAGARRQYARGDTEKSAMCFHA